MQTAGSLEKTLMLGKTEGRTRTGVTEEKTVGWHHRLNGHELEQTLGSLACCSPRSRKKSGTTEGLNNKKENLTPEVNEFSAFQCMGRCKNLDSQKPLFDMCPNNLDSVSCFSPPSAPAGAPSGRGCRSWGLRGGGGSSVSSWVPWGPTLWALQRLEGSKTFCLRTPGNICSIAPGFSTSRSSSSPSPFPSLPFHPSLWPLPFPSSPLSLHSLISPPPLLSVRLSIPLILSFLSIFPSPRVPALSSALCLSQREKKKEETESQYKLKDNSKGQHVSKSQPQEECEVDLRVARGWGGWGGTRNDCVVGRELPFGSWLQ